MKYQIYFSIISLAGIGSSFFSNLDPTPYNKINRVVSLPDTLYAHQKVFIPPYYGDFTELTLLYNGTGITATRLDGTNSFEVPALPEDTVVALVEIKSRFTLQIDTVTVVSERWLEFFLDPELQFSILWEGARPLVYSLVSSGKSQSPTSAAHTKIFDKKPSSEFYDGGLMRWWMSIQRTHNVKVITDSGEERFFPVLENGTHAPLAGTYHQVGSQASHGCIRNPLAKQYYDVLEIGDRVEMHYRNSGSTFRHERINGAYRFVNWEPVLTVDSSLLKYVEEARFRIIKEFELNH